MNQITKTFGAIVALSLATAPLVAQASSITLVSLTPEMGGSVNLNTGTSAWAFYGETNDTLFAQNAAVPTTDATNKAKFTLFSPSNGHRSNNPNGVVAFSYSGGAGGENPSSLSNSLNWEEVQSGVNGTSFSITSTLFAPTETFNFYLIDYDVASDLTLTLMHGASTTATWTQSDVILSGSNGSSATAADLTVTVTGIVGDVLTLKDAVDTAHVTQTSPVFDIVGLAAADVETVPEPSVFASLVAGLCALIFIRRLRNKRMS